MVCSPRYSCSEFAQFIWGHREVFCSNRESPFKDQCWCLAMSKGLLKHYFRWNEKQIQKQSDDWIQGLCWTLLPNSSLPFSTFAPWCQLHHFPHYVFCLWTPTLLFLPSPSLSCQSLHPVFLPFPNSGFQLFLFPPSFFSLCFSLRVFPSICTSLSLGLFQINLFCNIKYASLALLGKICHTARRLAGCPAWHAYPGNVIL